jgi:hypothetical protein
MGTGRAGIARRSAPPNFRPPVASGGHGMPARTIWIVTAVVVMLLAAVQGIGALSAAMLNPPALGGPPPEAWRPLDQPDGGCMLGDCDWPDGGCILDGCQLEDCLFPYTRFDVLYWRRDRPHNVALTSLGEDGPIVLDTDDLPMNDWEAMPRFSFGLPIRDDVLLEGVYFGTPTWESQASAYSAAGELYSTYSDFGTNPPGGYAETDQTNLQFAQYKSMLHNAEGNVLYLLSDPCCRAQVLLLGGLRYTNIREVFRYQTQAFERGQRTTIETYNNLLAWQLGCRIDAQLHRRLHVLFEGKAGLAVNLARQRTQILGILETPSELNESFNSDHLALVTDVGLTLVYDVCPWLSLRGGYHIMYVDGVALAPENFVPIAPATDLRVPAIDDHGAIFYQGATVGLEVRW